MEELKLLINGLISNPETNVGFAMILMVLGMIIPFLLRFLFPDK